MSELKSILLAEDDSRDAELILEALREYNLLNRITHVKDGVEALEYLRCEGKHKGRKPEHPAVIILDIKMPRMDGLEVLRVIRSDMNFRLIPVVMLTSSREEQDLIRSYEQGINAYVVKPVKFTDFIEAVKQIGVFWALLNEIPPERGKTHV